MTSGDRSTGRELQQQLHLGWPCWCEVVFSPLGVQMVDAVSVRHVTAYHFLVVLFFVSIAPLLLVLRTVSIVSFLPGNSNYSLLFVAAKENPPIFWNDHHRF